MNFIIDLLITMVAYMAYPFIKFKLSDNNTTYTKEQINKTCIINSIIVAFIFLMIGTNFIEGYTPNFAPAFVWYCINYSIFIKKEKINKAKSKDNKWEDFLEENFKATGTRTNMQELMSNPKEEIKDKIIEENDKTNSRFAIVMISLAIILMFIIMIGIASS